MKAARMLGWVAVGLAEAILGPFLVFIALLLDPDLLKSDRWVAVRPGNRRKGLQKLLPNADCEDSFDGGDGTILLDRKARAIALGWGTDRSLDRVIHRVDQVWRSSKDPRILILDLPDAACALELRFRTVAKAEVWQTEVRTLLNRA
ncbi:hypothetical protein EON81_06615 [bacterium]|nr:MAG: hypothetical protein EON81_06615 [bacterium]